METGKTGKYLKYAIGEILLVVIGILFALQINNWNERKIQRKAELQFYKNTKEQLLDDTKNILSQLDYNTKFKSEFEFAIQLIEKNNTIQKDSLGLIALNLLNYSDFDRQGNIYETTINSGNIKLLSNNDIIDGLRRLEETYMYVNRMETIHFDALMSMVPDLTQTIRFATDEVENEKKLYAFEFQNLFVLSLRIMSEKEEVYNRSLNEIEELIELMDQELQK